MKSLFSHLLFILGFRLIIWSKFYEKIVAFKDEKGFANVIFLGRDDKSLENAAAEYLG